MQVLSSCARCGVALARSDVVLTRNLATAVVLSATRSYRNYGIPILNTDNSQQGPQCTWFAAVCLAVHAPCARWRVCPDTQPKKEEHGSCTLLCFSKEKIQLLQKVSHRLQLRHKQV